MENDFPRTTGPDCGNSCAYYETNHGSAIYLTYSDKINVMSAPGVDFHGQMANAVADWSGEPYNSPAFHNCNCSNGFLTVGNLQYNLPGTSTTDTSSCGVADVSTAWESYGQTYDNHIVSAYADYNDKYSGAWFNDSEPSDYDGPYCLASQTAWHEVGHAFGEGHSTVKGDIMYYGGDAETQPAFGSGVDNDAQQLLLELYGTYQNTSNNGGSGGCNGCQVACPQVSMSTNPDGVQVLNSALWTVCGTGYALPDAWGYYAKLWDMSQGSPDLQPAASFTPQACDTYLLSKQMVLWLDCLPHNAAVSL